MTFGDGVGFARARHAEQDLVALAVLQPANELLNCGLLVAARGVGRCQSESHGVIGAGRAGAGCGQISTVTFLWNQTGGS